MINADVAIRSGFLPKLGRLSPTLRRTIVDPLVLLAVSLVLPVTATRFVAGSAMDPVVHAASFAFLVSQVGLGLLRPAESRRRALLTLVRLLFAVAYVGLAIQLIANPVFRPNALYLPIVAVAAAIGTRELLGVGALSAVLYLMPAFLNPPTLQLTVERGFALIAAAIVIAIGTRRSVGALDAAIASLRASVSAERRRNAQLDGIEGVAAVLAASGANSAAFAEVVEVLGRRLSYRFASLYLGNERSMVLEAQRGYQHPIARFDAGHGVMGRVMQTGTGAFIPDIRAEAGYAPGRDGTTSLICVPLISDGLLGILNVESAGQPLDHHDWNTVRLIADRVASAIALARRRDEVAARADLLGRLIDFSALVNRSDSLDELYRTIVVAAEGVVDGVAVLAIRDSEGSLVVRAEQGTAAVMVGIRLPGGTSLVDEVMRSGRHQFIDGPLSATLAPGQDPRALGGVVSTAAMPVGRDDGTIGVIVLVRSGDKPVFSPAEREILVILAREASLALANALLRDELRLTATRDALTGLYNRRHLEHVSTVLTATRSRQSPSDRRPLAAIMFDLDHFRIFNNRYGHQTGDAVLRAFAEVVRSRIRTNDTAFRYGGEEFLVLLEGAAADGARLVAQDIRQAVAALSLRAPNGHWLEISTSAGVADMRPSDAGPDAVIALADERLRSAKERGRDQVVG